MMDSAKKLEPDRFSVAPTATRTPISRVRWVTETIISLRRRPDRTRLWQMSDHRPLSLFYRICPINQDFAAFHHPPDVMHRHADVGKRVAPHCH
jgi:hypothetical protein